MNHKKVAKKIREDDLDLSGSGENLSLEEAKGWVNRIQPLLRVVPHIYNAFSRLASIVLQAGREDARIFNHLKTMKGYAEQAATELENGVSDSSQDNRKWYTRPLGIIAIAVISTVLGAIVIYLIKAYTGLNI